MEFDWRMETVRATRKATDVNRALNTNATSNAFIDGLVAQAAGVSTTVADENVAIAA